MVGLTARLGVFAGAALLFLAGCGSDGEPPAAGPTTRPAGATMAIEDAWVKAAPDGMSAAFGELRNNGSQDVTVVSATSPSSPEMELHETVENPAGEMIMQPREGGFVVPAGGTLTLEPGGNHLMLMDLTEPISAGDEVAFTITFSDRSTFAFTAPAKDYSGANETYEGGDMPMGGMSGATPEPTGAPAENTR
ncbi:copper chaperone PCu(A)C [Parafrankia elaeagni]|uniref:copper chaperone PCu(A)C n=1 Tax=Parafrankia elaeagni TaxID=222534 RepID=UPI00036384AF|nr:copper chaperone PCu(A)C [Parafrankia elaeagni]